MNSDKRLRIAIQKTGNLAEGSLELLSRAGLNLFSRRSRKLLFSVKEIPIDIMSVRDDDIPTFVSKGVCDLGIIGENLFRETTLAPDFGDNVEIKTRLGFSKCRLSIAIPNSVEYKSPKCLHDLKIATSYPLTLKKFLRDNSVQAEIVKMEGSVEVAPELKIADAICDLVSTGSMLEANNLKETEVILESEAVLIQRKDLAGDADRMKVLEKLMKRIGGVLSARDSKYVMLNAPKDKLEEIIRLLPGTDSPTIVPLADSHKVAVHAVCSEPVFWNTMESLKAAGATSILVMSIDKMLG